MKNKITPIVRYEVTTKDEYIYIKVGTYNSSYQLKLDEEGLVLDVVHENGELTAVFHCVNDEELCEEDT